MSKDLWFAEFERLLNEKEDAGMPSDEAYEQAGNEANNALLDRIGDMADLARLRKKESR